jgi:hypothetical protein
MTLPFYVDSLKNIAYLQLVCTLLSTLLRIDMASSRYDVRQITMLIVEQLTNDTGELAFLVSSTGDLFCFCGVKNLLVLV